MKSPKTVAFDSGHLCERGTEVALWDYAHFNETILGNRSLIFCPAAAPIVALDRFRARFSVILYRSRDELERLLDGVDVYYTIADGARPNPLPVRPPNGIHVAHCVFRADQPYGDVYAAVSDLVARDYATGDVPVVPHMVHVVDHDDDLRAQLGIPPDATVFGRHGGLDTFNVPFARDAVRRAVRERADAWFVFLNTRPFDDHERILWLEKNTDPDYKTAFINSCDAMLHARAEGETFGLAVGEFSVRNKPVITWLGGKDLYQVEVLGRKGIYYRTIEDLAHILRLFRPVGGDWDAYSTRFGPEPVMREFERVFLATDAASHTPRARHQAIPSTA